MLKVLIVDDEVNICKLIQRLIDWDGIGLALCGIANSADEALAIANSNRPDIVITDIKMTGKDGLELIKNLKDQYGHDLKCIIISGYKSFDYAYSAIKYGVVDFLLKPINQAELNSVLAKLVQEIQDNGAEQPVLAKNSNPAEFVRKQFLLTVIRQNFGQPLTVKNINREFYYNFTGDVFLAGIINLDNYSSNAGFNISLLMKLEDHFKDELTALCSDIGITKSNDNVKLIFLLNYDSKNQDKIDPALNRFLQRGMITLDPYSVLKLTIGKGSAITNPSDIYKSYYGACQAINSRIKLGTNKIIDITQINPDGSKAEFPDYIRLRTELRKYAELLNSEGLLLTATQILEEAQSAFEKYPWGIHKWYKEFWSTFIDIMHETHKDCDQSNLNKTVFSAKIDFFSSESDIRKKLFSHIEKAISNCEKEYSMMHSRIIHIVNQHIMDNFADKLDLDTIARQIHLSPAYLGILYKKETGINISEYITKVRIEKSKDLLRDVRTNISEVSFMVGYKDTRYFSNLFKKIVGVKPSEYRKIVHLNAARGK